MVGSIRDGRRMLSVRTVCGTSLSHWLSGKLELVELRPAMKWCLKVWMARSARFLRWSPAGVS